MKKESGQHKAEAGLTAFFDQPAGLHIIANLGGTIERANTSWERDLGYTPAELVGRNIKELIHPDDLKATREALEQLEKGWTVSRFENRYRHKDGSWHKLLWWSSVPQNDNKIYAIAHDLTGMNEAQDRLELALKGADLGTWDWHIPSGHVVFNRRWAEMIGYKLKEIEPDIRIWKQLVHPDDLPSVEKALTAHLKGKTDSYETEHRIRHKNGNWLWILNRGRVIDRDENGDPIRVCGTHLDITDKKQALLREKESRKRLKYMNLVLKVIRNINQLIATEKDQEALLQQSCEMMISNQGLQRAWIALIDPKSSAVTEIYSAGFGNDFDAMETYLKTHGLPSCAQQALHQDVPVLIKEPSTQCPDCPLSEYSAEQTGLVQKLDCEGRIYGVLSVSAPSRFAEDEEEKGLIHELAGDLARALDKNKFEKKLELTEFALNSSSDTVFWIAPDGRFTFVNEAACRQLGYTRDELLSMSVPDIDPDFPAEYWPDFWLEMKAAGAMRFESLHKTKDGRVFPIEIYGSFISHGSEEHIFAFVHDITERKKQQQAMEEANRLLEQNNADLQSARRAALNIMQDAVLAKEKLIASEARLQRAQKIAQVGDWEFNLKTGEVNTSESAKRIYGLPDSKQTIADIQKIPLPKFRPTLDAAMENLVKTGTPYDVEFTIRRPSDQTLAEVHSIAEYDSQNETVFGVIQDITARKQAETELLRLSTVIEQSPEAVAISNMDRDIIYVNPAYTEITGYRAEEVIGRAGTLTDYRDENPEVFERMNSAIAKGEVWTGRFPICHKDGNIRILQGVLSPIRDQNNNVINTVAIQWDVTDEIKREEQLQQAQKMEAVGQLAGGIAHDFNNILQAILGFSELLVPAVENKKTAHQNVLEIQKAARHAADLTRQLLAFSRKQPVETDVVDLNQVINETQSILASIIGEKIQIRPELQADSSLIWADEQQLGRIIINLAINARDAMPQGGTLTLRTQTIHFSKEDAKASANARAGHFVCLSVTDTGTGMSEQTMQHIFEPFFSTKAPGKGTGLGLASIYGIVQKHNGWINVYSELDQGSTFKIYFPAASENNPAKNTDNTSSLQDAVHGNGEHILIVEDDPAIRTLSEKSLGRAGYTVQTASSAEEALDLFKKAGGSFDLLFSDVVLPGKSGVDLAAALKANQPNLKIIFCSGYSNNQIQAEMIQQENIYFLEKPFSIVNLLKLTHRVLSSKK